jgi:HPt (histidine-containing phosphotransfer) domain-containing protein
MSVVPEFRTPAAGGLPAWDRELALARAGGDATRAARYLEMLLGTFGEVREGLATGVQEGRWPDIQQRLHTLAGASLYCAATALHGAARRAEAMLKDDRMADAEPLVGLVLEEMARLEAVAREGDEAVQGDQGADS